MYSMALGWAPGYELCVVVPMVNTYRASSLGSSTRGDCAVPVCRLSERDIKIQFCRNGAGSAARNSAGVFTLGLSIRYFLMPADSGMGAGPSGAKSTISGIENVTLNVARTVRATFMVTVQAPMPEQSPLQPTKLERAPGAAERVTISVLPYGLSQSAPQLIPATLVEVMVPVPRPVFITFKSAASTNGANSRHVITAATSMPT